MKIKEVKPDLVGLEIENYDIVPIPYEFTFQPRDINEEVDGCIQEISMHSPYLNDPSLPDNIRRAITNLIISRAAEIQTLRSDTPEAIIRLMKRLCDRVNNYASINFPIEITGVLLLNEFPQAPGFTSLLKRRPGTSGIGDFIDVAQGYYELEKAGIIPTLQLQ